MVSFYTTLHRPWSCVLLKKVNYHRSKQDLKYVLLFSFNLIATTVGGGYINGTAESIASSGLVWTLAPFGIFIGLILGNIFVFV